MTVGQLIEKLETCDEDSEVFIPVGLDDAEDIINVIPYSDSVYLEY